MASEYPRSSLVSGSLSRDAPCVLIAYVDTFLGGHLLRHFTHDRPVGRLRPRVYACAWDKLRAEEMAAAETDHPIDASTLVNESEMGDALPSNETTMAHPITPTAVGAGSVTYFWRGDSAALRRAILDADHIVLEVQQAQDVFDTLHVLATRELLSTKRLVVVSSLLTWYATPPLQPPERDDEKDETLPASDARADDEEEEEAEEEEALCPIRGEAEETLLGPPDAEEPAEAEDDAEVFTEDQYNRRVPHAKYYNWRDAERAVAAAHSEEQRIETFVVFAGLMYGDGEDALRPFFSHVWSRAPRGLPIFGDGKQMVPAVHVRDLATLTVRLVETREMPPVRYVFGVDRGISTWRQMIKAMNRAFGGEAMYHVRPEDYVLHRGVELFTMNMRVDNQTMRDVMPEETDWVAQGGFVENMAKIAHEYVKKHDLGPLRIVLLGPPLSGKTTLATALAQRHYDLPTFTMERVVEEYKTHVAALKDRLEHFRQKLFESERSRREAVKRRAFLRRRGRKAKQGDGGEEEENMENADKMKHGDGKRTAPSENPAADMLRGTMAPDGVGVGMGVGMGMGGVGAMSLMGVTTPTPTRSRDEMETTEMHFDLTEDESREVTALVEEWFQQSERAQQLRDAIAAMEHVLTMKVRLPPPVQPDALSMANTKRRRENARAKRPSKSMTRREEDTAATEAADAAANAPFQDRALALMLRWRLSRADCMNQGYILDGFPETVAQARLVFAEGTMEVADTNATAVEDATPAESNAAPAGPEVCDEARLPDFVFVLEASVNFLLDRLSILIPGMSPRTTPSGANTPTHAPTAQVAAPVAVMAAGVHSEEDERRLARFEESLALHKRQFIETEYALSHFFEGARTAPTPLTPGGRAPSVSTARADGEPLRPPPPPASAFAAPVETSIETALCRRIGRPRNLGPTPRQEHEEEVRERALQEEEQEEVLRAMAEQKDRERLEFMRESEERAAEQRNRELIEAADRDALEERKAPLREYLRQNIVPLLSKGLVEVCKVRPKDPVDFLAEWLTRHNPLDDGCVDL